MDNGLIYKARQGDAQAADVIVEEYKVKVKSIARGYFLTGGGLDDLIQEGMIGLFKAINSYDPEKSDDFNAFALMCVNREIINCIKKNNTYKNRTLNNTVSLDSLNESAPKSLSPENIVLVREDNVQLMRLMDENLSKMEKRMVSAYIKGFSYAEIAEKYGVSAKTVDNALQRARNKLSKLLQR